MSANRFGIIPDFSFFILEMRQGKILSNFAGNIVFYIKNDEILPLAAAF